MLTSWNAKDALDREACGREGAHKPFKNESMPLAHRQYTKQRRNFTCTEYSAGIGAPTRLRVGRV